jgi:adenosine deaminase
MAKASIPIEISLTSNRKILDVYGKNHPINHYLAHHVPIVLSTDDEGILRTNLTQEYVNAVIQHELDYATIKTINRNALTYSFLPGKSLWENPNQDLKVHECQDLNASSCLDFISHSKKARLQWKLEQQLIDFENKYHDNTPQRLNSIGQ